MATKTTRKKATVAERLDALENLQSIHSEIDRIRTVRGELPLEVEDLEVEVESLQRKADQLTTELGELETEISDRKNGQKDAQAAIIQYEKKQDNVRNNREFESLKKEIEYQELEIQLHDKKIKEAKANIEHKEEAIKEANERLVIRTKDLEAKNAELDDIIAETEKEEEKLAKKAETAKKKLDDHLQKAYARLRENMRNGLAVVSVNRSACGGCFSEIPPQRQIDIFQKKKITTCEHCGRILVPGEELVPEPKKKKRKTTRKKKSTVEK